MPLIKDFLAGCYQGLTIAQASSSIVCGEGGSTPYRRGTHVRFALYFAGTAMNQISNPNRMSALRSEKAVCKG